MTLKESTPERCQNHYCRAPCSLAYVSSPGFLSTGFRSAFTAIRPTSYMP